MKKFFNDGYDDPYYDDPFYDDYTYQQWLKDDAEYHQHLRDERERADERIRQEQDMLGVQEQMMKFVYPSLTENDLMGLPKIEKPMYSKAEDILRDALMKAKETIAQQQQMLEQLLQAPTTRGYVLSINSQKVYISIPGVGLAEVPFPEEPVHGKDIAPDIKAGSIVRVQTQPVPAIVDIIKVGATDNSMGDIVTALKPGSNFEVEVEWQGTSRIVIFSPDLKSPEIGDRLLVDVDCNIVIRNMGLDESKFSFHGTTGVSWDQIGGLELAKEALQEAIELPFLHAELYKRYNKKPIKGVLLYGPPGCGKTMLAKAAATSLSKLHERSQADTGFIYVKGPELLNKYVGNTEAQVRSLFAQARKHHKNHGYPAVIFIDEADALLSARGSRHGMGIEGTVVPQFLAEMDGLDETGALVLLATNRPDSLDSAVVRDGRIDRKVQVTRPNQNEAVNIFKLYLKNQPLHELSVDDMAQLAAQYIFSEDLKLSANLTLANLVNGAMIAGMVDKASTLALRREISKTGHSGIGSDDMMEATLSIYEQNRHLNHSEEIREFMEQQKSMKPQTATV